MSLAFIFVGNQFFVQTWYHSCRQFCKVEVGFTWVVYNVCGHPLWGDISWYGDLLSSKRNLEDRRRWSRFLTIKKPWLTLHLCCSPFNTHDFNQQPSKIHTMTSTWSWCNSNSKQQPRQFGPYLSSDWQLTHTSSGNSSLTSDIISDVFPTLAVWENKRKNILILILHYTPFLLIMNHGMDKWSG